MVLSRLFTTCGAASGAAIGLAYVWIKDINAGGTESHSPFQNLKTWDSSWDSAHNVGEAADAVNDLTIDQLKQKRSKFSRTLVLVRHGHYNLSGASDAERQLTELGRKQALLVGKRLNELHGEDKQFDRIITSGLTRAKETTDLILTQLKTIATRIEDPLLNEGRPYPIEPPLKHYQPKAEVLHEDNGRIEEAFRKYFYRAPTTQKKNTIELIVCHANVIRYFVCRALQFPPEGWLRMSLQHCSITIIVIRPDGRVVLKALGDHGHIPKEYLSFVETVYVN